jgi:hypothetical protein
MTGPYDATLLDDLRRVVRGELDGPEFFARHGSSRQPGREWLWAGLPHYFADADIRAKDASYRAMQEHELSRLIRLLEAGATEAELLQITFLGRTGD